MICAPKIPNSSVGGWKAKSIAVSIINLFDVAPDGAQIPWLGTEWSSNPEGTVWTAKMHEGAKFHDGSPVTLADVKFTYDRLLAHPDFQHSTSFIDLLGSVDTPDDYTVVFNCAKPAPLFNLLMTEQILSKKSADENGENFWEKAIGAVLTAIWSMSKASIGWASALTITGSRIYPKSNACAIAPSVKRQRAGGLALRRG